MNIDENGTTLLNINLINVFTCGYTWKIAERNAVLLVMSPFNVPIACVQVNIDKSLLSTVNTVRRKGLENLGFKGVHGRDNGELLALFLIISTNTISIQTGQPGQWIPLRVACDWLVFSRPLKYNIFYDIWFRNGWTQTIMCIVWTNCLCNLGTLGFVGKCSYPFQPFQDWKTDGRTITRDGAQCYSEEQITHWQNYSTRQNEMRGAFHQVLTKKCTFHKCRNNCA